MKFEKEYIELYGFILGDGTFRDARWKQMTFYNYNLNLIEYVKELIEKILDKEIKIHNRKKNNSIEYSINIPSKITKKLVELSFSKKEIPGWIIKSKYNINFLKAFFECEGTLNNHQIMIYQAKREILDQCISIANKYGLSAHVHKSSIRRKNDFYLAIEDVEKIKKIFGNTIKEIPPLKRGKEFQHYTKRIILRILSRNKWLTTTQIFNELENENIKMSRISNALLNKHLKPLNKSNIIIRNKGYSKRDIKGKFYGIESKWKLNKQLSESQILNYPYIGEME